MILVKAKIGHQRPQKTFPNTYVVVVVISKYQKSVLELQWMTLLIEANIYGALYIYTRYHMSALYAFVAHTWVRLPEGEYSPYS